MRLGFESAFGFGAGAGKSTLLKYLLGEDLARVEGAGGERFVVEGDARIGAGAVSQTLLPGVHSFGRGVATDCPGSLDTRAPAVNVANGINVAACVEAASSAKFLVLIEYGTAKAARGSGVKKVFLALAESFG